MAATIAAVAAFAAVGCDPAPIDGTLCNLERPCPEGFSCFVGQCRPVTTSLTCSADTECAVGVCMEKAGFCVQCEHDDHCGFGRCLEGYHVCGCTQGADCPTGRCALEDGKAIGFCAACYDDAQCAGKSCNRETGRCD